MSGLVRRDGIFLCITMEYCFGVDDKSEEDKSIRAIVKKKYLALKQSSGL